MVLDMVRETHQHGNFLQEWAEHALGEKLVERIDSATPAAERHMAIRRFNAPDR